MTVDESVREPAAQRLPPPPAPAVQPDTRSPALACCLSAIAGLGHVYLGYYRRGFIHAIVIAGLITLLASGDLGEAIPLVALFMVFYWLYVAIDAARRAALHNRRAAGGEILDFAEEPDLFGGRGSLAAGASMIVIGGVLLANTRFDISLDWVGDWWPLAPMLVGGYLVWRALQERSTADPTRGV